MAHAVPNTNPATNASFQDWLNNTNLSGRLLSANAVTTAANSVGEGTSGNGFINGVFAIDTLVANNGLRGGTVTTPNTLNITSNVNITGNTITIGNSSVNTVINSTFISTTTISGAVTITGINFGNATVNAVGNSTVYELNSTSSTLFVNSSIFSVGNNSVNVVANSTTVIIGSGTINATMYSGKANDAANFGGQPPSFYIGLAGSSNNALFLGSLPANAYAVLANNNSFTGNNTFAGTNTVFNSNVIINGTETSNNIVANTLTVKAITSNGNIAANGNIVANGSITGVTLQTNNASIASNVTVINGTSQFIVDSFPKINSQCAKYLIFVYNTTAKTPVHSIEVMMIHDGNASVIQTQYGELFNSNLGTFDAAINNANVEVYFTAASANSSNTLTVKLIRTQVI